MMKILRLIVLGMVVFCLLTVAGFVTLVGPWPPYSDSIYKESRYFTKALAAIETQAAKATVGEKVQHLKAGWAQREITPEAGHPMAGYGGRANDKKSTGILEPLYVKALALSDGTDTVVLIGSDMLQTLPNLLEAVEARISKSVNLTNRNIMYTSSHTHCGPGGLAPGFAAEFSYGPYKPEYLDVLVDCFAGAIEEAVNTMTSAKFAHGAVAVPEYILNRTRTHGTVDPTLNVAAVEKVDGGERLYLARYSAHGTTYSEEMLELNGDYAGAFQRAVLEKSGAPLLFMGGAMGSMRPNPPGPPVPEPWTKAQELGFEHDVESTLVREGKMTKEEWLNKQRARVEAMGVALAERLLEATPALEFNETLDIASLDAIYDPPPAQVRILSPKWRLSPFAFNVLGVPKKGRMQAARIGDMFLVGMPNDFSGETSLVWQEWARERNANLWVTSFSGAYLGYLSPDKYYHEMGEGLHYNQNYEIGMMSWFGPNHEAYVTDLFHYAFETLTDSDKS